MSIIIKDITVIDDKSPFHLQKVDIFYKNGKIEDIGTAINATAKKVLNGQNHFISPSWIDTFADYASPGREHRETLKTGSTSAFNSGFGTVFLVPNTTPIIDNASAVRNIVSMANKLKTDIKVLGAITQATEGKVLAEMLDMYHAGAVGFTDGWMPIQSDITLLKALEYIKAFDGVIIQQPINNNLNGDGLMNESDHSMQLGMSGMPAMAEHLRIQREIALVQYTNSKVHITGVSTAKGLQLIQKAKKENIKVTCSVTPYHLLWNDELLEQYDSIYKVNPPLRSKHDAKALVKGLENGSIDCIATHHKPHDWDEKTQEYAYAEWGIACTEVAWPMLVKAAPKLSPEQWIHLLAKKPAEIFNLESAVINKGEKISLTCFNFDEKWTLSKKEKASKAFNVPLLGEQLVGKAFVL